MSGVFKLPEPAVHMAVASVGRPGWQAFSAWDGDQMVGAAASFIHQETAQFFAAGAISRTVAPSAATRTPDAPREPGLTVARHRSQLPRIGTVDASGDLNWEPAV